MLTMLRRCPLPFSPLPFLAMMLFAAVHCTAQKNAGAASKTISGKTLIAQPIPADAKEISEHTDAKGNIVRTYQYVVAGKMVTETRIVPPENYGYRVPLNPDTLNKDSVLIIVTKTRNKLEVFYRKNLVRVYKSVGGPKPGDNKMVEGDRCTPEGWFRITQKNPSSHYHRFMLLDYPNDSTNARFTALKAAGKIPATAKPGNAIGIHGVWKGGDDMVERRIGWTDGCIALRNKDLDELYRMTKEGTRVFIRK